MVVLVDVGCDCNDCTGFLVAPQTLAADRVDRVDASKRDTGNALEFSLLIIIHEDFRRSEQAAPRVRRECLDDHVGNFGVQQDAVETKAGDRSQTSGGRIDLAETERSEFEQTTVPVAIARGNLHAQREVVAGINRHNLRFDHHLRTALIE